MSETQESNKYANAKIYKIESNGEAYYGSTTKLVSERFSKHKAHHKRWKQGKETKNTVYDLFDKYGTDNCTISLVEDFPCKSKTELHEREGYYIKNNACVNRSIAGRTQKEWRNDNKEKLALDKKAYFNEHKSEISEYKRKYAQQHKDKIAQYQKQDKESNRKRITQNSAITMQCACGSIFRINDKARHERSQKHHNYLEDMGALHEFD
jgi:lipopolysaccharide export LptBFGC system permease protein LptF